MGTYDTTIQIPITKQPVSASQFGIPVRNAILDLDARVSDLEALNGPWIPYSATISGSTTNPTYTATGFYIATPKLCIFRANFVLITIGSGTYTVSTPFPSAEETGMPYGICSIAASGAGNRLGRLGWQNGANSIGISDEATGARIGSATPASFFAAGSIIAVKGTYQPQ